MSTGFHELTMKELEKLGAEDTAREILNQPRLWQETYELILEQKDKIVKFLEKVYKFDNLNVILTGAGSSAFIGEILEGPFQKNTKKFARAVATTDLVTHAENYLLMETPTLMISFARSGNSPESLAAVEVANFCCSRLFHIIITCNENGELNKSAGMLGNALSIVLPKETNDKALAMTSSFTSMLLAGLLISRINYVESLEPKINLLKSYAERLFSEYMPLLKSVAELDFDRVVFLGSGPLQGAAKESHLKLQELNDGKVICKHDSFLGFRHGPRAVIKDSTLIVYLFSNNEHVHLYEKDLADQVNGDGLFKLGVVENSLLDLKADKLIELSDSEDLLPEEFLAVCYVLPAQIIGLYKSINFGLKPDNPSVKGSISRVVEGVKIYPFNKNIKETEKFNLAIMPASSERRTF